MHGPRLMQTECKVERPSAPTGKSAGWALDLPTPPLGGSDRRTGAGIHLPVRLSYELDDCYLTISLGEPFQEQDAVYKLIAAVIED